MDTVTSARQERGRQGSCEVEVSYEGEVGLHRHLDDCGKNPGHVKFIPVDQFNVDHLPPGYHDNDLVEYIRAMSDLTVRVSVKYVSERRPATVPGSDKPYPGYRNSGCHIMMAGTGSVWRVTKYTDKDSDIKTCECNECLNSPTPKTRFAHIHIATAAHVVYDDLEGAHTTCHLFFDKGGTPDVCSSVVTLSGMSDVRSDIEKDYCLMTYVTHDLDLVDRLDKAVTRMQVLYNCVRDTCALIRSDQEKGQLSTRHVRDESRLAFIVSHPHGCSKQVSVGHLVNEGDLLYTYTTATCPGSSGARVCWMGDSQGWWFGQIHIGNCEDNKQLNYCHFEL